LEKYLNIVVEIFVTKLVGGGSYNLLDLYSSQTFHHAVSCYSDYVGLGLFLLLCLTRTRDSLQA